MNSKLIKEALAMALIGDGVLTAVGPKRHLGLWRFGPKKYVRALDAMSRHPNWTRTAGVAAAAAGVWWACRQQPQQRRFPFLRSA